MIHILQFFELALTSVFETIDFDKIIHNKKKMTQYQYFILLG
jgi:hypothetical protein